MTKTGRILALALAAFGLLGARGGAARGQDALVVRTGPPRVDDFETDVNKDGVPDGWYNLRDARLLDEGGAPGAGPRCLRFEARKPGRPARLSLAFGVDGRKSEAIVLGLWVRCEGIELGERLGDEPGLIIDFLGDELRALRHASLGPWTRSVGAKWTRVVKRIAVPPGTRDAIMSIGLLGAIGLLDVDGLTIDLVPAGGAATTNLVVNGGFELGDPAPAQWLVEGGAHRAFPGAKSSAGLELAKGGARALTGLAVPVEPFEALEVSAIVRAHALRGAGGAHARLFFLDDDGGIVPDATGQDEGQVVFRWSGTFDWRAERAVVAVPRGSIRAVLQFEKLDGAGTVRIDNVAVAAAPDPTAGAWTPYHVEDEATDWPPVTPSKEIAARSALDFSFLLEAPAGKHGFVTVRDGRLAFAKGGRVRFFGVSLLPPTAFQDGARADALADRLARSGVNLVRLGELDMPLGPDRSLFDDTRDDTKAFDPIALARLDHLIAALKARGIYVALELLSTRRYRAGDGVAAAEQLPLGGGPAAVFDPVLGQLALDAAKALLNHVNPETRLALRDDPVLAWVTLAGELSLFDLPENPLPVTYADALRNLAAKNTGAPGRKFWETTGASHWKEEADALRKDKVRVPIAGVSHWRRDAEFGAEQAAAGLDLIDDRLYWNPPQWVAPGRRSLLWSLDGGLAAGAVRKRRVDRPYVVGQWCQQTGGAWASPFEGADVMLASATALAEDWDALTRRGVFIHPEPWGNAAAGTGGGEDVFQIPEVVNGIPPVFALWPHAASLLLKGTKTVPEAHATPPAHRAGTRPRPTEVPGWRPSEGRLIVKTEHTQGVVGWAGDDPYRYDILTIETDNPYAVVVVSSATAKPISGTNRLLVTALARVEPAGFKWVDGWRRDVADPGQAPLLQEPVRARVLWRRKGSVKAYALDNTGARGEPARLRETPEGSELIIDGSEPGLHWELVVE